MLWVDKYRPKDLNQFIYHRSQADKLKNIAKTTNFPHLLIYGPDGSGKKTMIQCLLKEIYGNGVERLKYETQQIVTPSNKKLEISTIASNYHIELNPSNVGIYDRIVMMDVIKNIAQNQQLNLTTTSKTFKIVVLNSVEDLSKDAQHALRRLMEKYITNCRLILSTSTVSRVVPAIRSRCLPVRVAAPSHLEITAMLNHVAEHEALELPPVLAERIAAKCDRNMRRALLMLETTKTQQYPFAEDQPVHEPDWLLYIKEMVNLMVTTQNMTVVLKLREMLRELISNGIPYQQIFLTLLDNLMLKCDQSLLPQIIEQMAIYEHRMMIGDKAIFHLEAFVVKFMSLHQNFLQELVMDEF